MKERAKIENSPQTYSERYLAEQKQKKVLRNEMLKKQYSQIRKIEFKTIGPSDMTKHFRFPIVNGGSNLPMLAKAVYPVLCSRADFLNVDSWAQISRENIGKLAGLSPSVVDKGLKMLKGYTLNEVHFVTAEKVQKGPRRLFRYQVNFSRITEEDAENYRYFIFYTAIIDSGIWAELSLRAKALYISMRETAFFNQKLYEEVTKAEKESLPARPRAQLCPYGHKFNEDVDKFDDCDDCELWDYCTDGDSIEYKWLVSLEPLAELCRRARISYSNIGLVVTELENAGLIEKYGGIRIVNMHSEKYLNSEEIQHD